MARLLEQHVDTARRGRPEALYECFRKMDPKDFSGTTDPLVAEEWIRFVEVIFRFMAMADVDRVRCATYLLKGDAGLWWEGVEKSVDLDTLTWEEFKMIFYEKYFTADVRSRMKREFMSLRQRDLFVAEDVRKFDRGCHFVPLIANDAAEKLRHFTDGLWPTIHRDVMMADPTVYSVAIVRAFRAEQALKDIAFERQRKRPPPVHQQPQHQQRKKPFRGPQRPQGQQPHKPAVPNTDDKPLCKQRNRKHHGKCMWGSNKCFKCGATGLISMDCPQLRQAAPGRLFVIHAEEVDLDTTLVIGRIYISGVATKALLDSGTTHSFISEIFASYLGIKSIGLDVSYAVTFPSGEELSATKMVRDIDIELQGHTVYADLIVLPMPGFDIILGMD